MSQDYTLYICPGCSQFYWTGVNSHAVKIGGVKCGECGTHFGVEAGEGIFSFDKPRGTHECMEKPSDAKKMNAVNVDGDCRFCGKGIDGVEKFDSREEYDEEVLS